MIIWLVEEKMGHLSKALKWIHWSSVDNRRTQITLTIYLVIYSAILFGIGLRVACWGDECTMVAISQSFGERFSFELLRTYDYPGTPLPFFFYGMWGKLFGYSLPALRSASLLLAFISFWSLYRWIKEITCNSKIGLFLTFFISINPYMAGICLFVYRDILAFLLAILCFRAVFTKDAFQFGIWVALGILCSQFFVFIPVAAGLYWFASKFTHQRLSIVWLVAIIMAFIPYGFLYLFWQGPYPNNNLRGLISNQVVFIFRPSYLTLYIILLFAYLLPVLIFYWRNYLTNKCLLLGSLGTSWFYFVFPLTSSFIPNYGYETTGYLHKFVRLLLGEQFEGLVFFPCFVLGCLVLGKIIQDGWKTIRKGEFGFVLFVDLSILSFLIIMPFTFLSWEKYFLPVIPLVALQIIQSNQVKKYPILATINDPIEM
jgi:hypothetical protein